MFEGPANKDAVKAKHDREKQAETQRLNADKSNSSLSQGSSVSPVTVEERRLRQEQIREAQKRQEERFQEERSRAVDGSALDYTTPTVYAVPLDQQQPQTVAVAVPEPEPEPEETLNMEVLFGDLFRADMDIALLLHLLRHMGIADEDADVDTALKQGAEFAKKLDAACDLVEMARSEDVRNACAFYEDPARKDDGTPQEALVCAQLVRAIAQE